MAKKPLRCPSSYPGGIDAKVFAVVVGSVDEPEVKYLKKSIDATDQLLQSVSPAEPTEVFRFSSNCIDKRCGHYDSNESKCTLVQRTIQFINPKIDNLNPCAIRKSCVWRNQEGKEACVRCPQVVRDGYPVSRESLNATRPPKYNDSNAKQESVMQQ